MESEKIKFTFLSADGTRQQVVGAAGETVMEVAYANGIEGITAECGGSMSCGTCHVYLDETTFAQAEAPSENEVDMLDIVSSERRPTSRLSCQIKLSAALSGAEVTIPETQF
ncbi:2Fe-2S iron-sulfur cluster-binding protein [Novosphingobium taihuense]|uniref:2Fe-2S ferredoxin n=1 Tax=Novosphingobium taihuense TaxID=260085 RepID=A0A7W7ADI4_9SPHN|nr:2Fe-2S iron-sulfur cluster-binding protein [Novosphingobium taihuense]MBB4614265.1 2Fe-2S ferredoxin [Novosphingobium taihuense]TWH87112.1 2Fe-2S ferredoxin [Novosphingobium taihuense]